MKGPPHPAWRRLYATGGAPARLVQRMAQAGRELDRLAESTLPQWLFAPSLEALLRPIDLSGIERKALAISDHRAASQLTRAGVLRRAPEYGEELRRKIGRDDAPAAEQRSRPSARELDQVAAILRRYNFERAAADSAKSRNIALASAPDGSRSSAAPIITPADAAASLRRRSIRAGDAAIAHSAFTSGPGGSPAIPRSVSAPAPAGAGAISPLAEGSRARTESAASPPRSVPAADTAGAGKVEPTHAIARIARRLEDLRGAAAGSGLRRARRQLSRQREAASAPFAQDADVIAATEQGGLRGLAARVSHGVHSASDLAARRQWQTGGGPATSEAPLSAEGEPVGLAARVARRAERNLRVEGARNAPDLEDFAERLDQLLRREARRNGIDLEEIDR